MKELEYPFEGGVLIVRRKSILRELRKSVSQAFLSKKIAILGGSTTASIRDMLEVFLLSQGIDPEFYESEYAQYWQDAMFSENLIEFKPDIIFIHTSFRNITKLPKFHDSVRTIDLKLETQFEYFKTMWEKLISKCHCPIIQNNFERPIWRLMGNRDTWDLRCMTNFVSRLNQRFYEFAQTHSDFFINDIDYLCAQYGLDKWHDVYYWHLFKYALAVPAIPSLAFSVANIIKSIYGKNKKALVLDLDNTLWGGVIGDDEVDGIDLGPEVSMGQAYSEFQSYVKSLKDIGVILTVSSKNEEKNAIAGLNHPDSVLHREDFAVIKANWNNKDLNIRKIAATLNIGIDSLVFVEDNPAERAIVRYQLPEVAVPEVNTVEDYIRTIDNNGYFETTNFSAEDLVKSKMYIENTKRSELALSFEDYRDFLTSLKMIAIIRDFESIYMQRISQLINKSNQFNLTTKRYSQSDIEQVTVSSEHIRLCGKLSDKFGDNGLVSVIIGKKKGYILDIELWVMSCRVLNRQMEDAMLDRLVEEVQKVGIKTLKGYYYPTVKNAMVRDFYKIRGFTKINEDTVGNSQWELDIRSYNKRNDVIEVKK